MRKLDEADIGEINIKQTQNKNKIRNAKQEKVRNKSTYRRYNGLLVYGMVGMQARATAPFLITR
jgi:hypothetical protein